MDNTLQSNCEAVDHYAANNPVKYTDPDGCVLETLWDIGLTLVDTGIAIYKSAKGDNSGWVDVGVDALAILIPCVPAGLSKIDDAVKLAKGADKISDAVRAADKVGDVTKVADNAGNIRKFSKGPYSYLADSKYVGEGKAFTQTQKHKIIEQNMKKNGGVVKSDLSGKILEKPSKSTKGVTPSPNEWQIDHIDPRSKGGTNSYSNAQVLSRNENVIKSNN